MRRTVGHGPHQIKLGIVQVFKADQELWWDALGAQDKSAAQTSVEKDVENLQRIDLDTPTLLTVSNWLCAST